MTAQATLLPHRCNISNHATGRAAQRLALDWDKSAIWRLFQDRGIIASAAVLYPYMRKTPNPAITYILAGGGVWIWRGSRIRTCWEMPLTLPLVADLFLEALGLKLVLTEPWMLLEGGEYE